MSNNQTVPQKVTAAKKCLLDARSRSLVVASRMILVGFAVALVGIMVIARLPSDSRLIPLVVAVFGAVSGALFYAACGRKTPEEMFDGLWPDTQIAEENGLDKIFANINGQPIAFCNLKDEAKYEKSSELIAGRPIEAFGVLDGVLIAGFLALEADKVSFYRKGWGVGGGDFNPTDESLMG